MNKKLRLSLLLLLAGSNVDMRASESGLNTIAISLVSGAAIFGTGIVKQCFRAIGMLNVAPQSLGDLAGESACAAALVAVCVAPVYYVMDIEHHESAITSRRWIHQNSIQHMLTKNLDNLHKNGKVKSERDNNYYKYLCDDQWQLQRFNELCKKESLGGSDTEQIALTLSLTVLSPTSFIALSCDCPEVAVATLAATYGALGLAKLTEKIEKEKLNRIIEQIDEVYLSDKAEYANNEEFLARVDSMILDVVKKNEEDGVDNLKYHKQKEAAREKIAREVFAKYNFNQI